jgi:hypothetical protein
MNDLHLNINELAGLGTYLHVKNTELAILCYRLQIRINEFYLELVFAKTQDSLEKTFQQGSVVFIAKDSFEDKVYFREENFYSLFGFYDVHKGSMIARHGFVETGKSNNRINTWYLLEPQTTRNRNNNFGFRLVRP